MDWYIPIPLYGTIMNIDNFIMGEDNEAKHYKSLFKVLHCHVLWVMNLNHDLFTMLATDRAVLEHYWDKKYFLQDPNIHIKKDKLKNNLDQNSPWKISLGTDCVSFHNNGFLYDLYKLFNIEEFVSIEKKIGLEYYCFRLFTKNNRFVFMNKLLNDMPIIKYYINSSVEKFKIHLDKQPGIHLREMK